MSTSIKRLSQNGQEFVPITLQEAVVVNTNGIPGLEQLKITTLDKVLRATYGILGNNSGSISQLQSAVDTINTALINKQDKLTAGAGIKIENGIISVTNSLELYKIVTDLPSASAEVQNTIYLKPSAGVSGNEFTEYICVKKGTSYTWEQIGTITSNVDLSGYITLDQFNSELNPIKAALSNTITAQDVTTSSGNVISVSYDIPDNLYDGAIIDSTDYI